MAQLRSSNVPGAGEGQRGTGGSAPGGAPGRSPTGSPAAYGPWHGGDRVSVRHEGSEGTTQSGSAGTGPCGRDGSRVRAELAAGGCHGQAGQAGRSAGSGTVSGCPPCRNQLRPLDRVGCTRQGWDEAWRDLRSGTVGLRLCRRCGTCAAGASPPVPAVRGLHLRAERDGAGVAVAVGQQGCGTGRQTRLWHWRGGAAMLAPALAHPRAEPSLSLSLPSHGRCCGGDGLCPRPRAGPRCPLPRLLRCTLTHLAAPAIPLGAGVPGLRCEGILGSQRGAGAAGRRAGGGGAGQDHVVGTFALRGRRGGL